MAKAPPGDLEGVNWADISRRLTLFAKKRLGTRGTMEDAQEIAQEAICQVLDPEYADWDRDKEPDLLRYLGSVVNGIINNRVRRKRAKLEHAVEQGELDAAQQQEPPSPEDRFITAAEIDRVITLLSERLVKDELGQQVLLCFIDGNTEAAEQAKHLGRPVREIYNARRRLEAHRDAVREILAAEDSNEKKPTN